MLVPFGVRQANAVPIDVPDDQVAALVGHYTSQNIDADIGLLDNALTLTLDVKEAALSDEAPDPIPPMPVALYDTDRFIILDGRLKDQRGEVLRDAGGTITWIRLGGRLYKREA